MTSWDNLLSLDSREVSRKDIERSAETAALRSTTSNLREKLAELKEKNDRLEAGLRENSKQLAQQMEAIKSCKKAL